MILIFDVDGTLIDSVKAHAAAWQTAFSEYGFHFAFDRIRGQIGKGSDELLKEFLSPEDSDRIGEELSDRRAKVFASDHMHTVRPFPGVRELFERIHIDGHQLVLGTSAKGEELESYLKLLGIEGMTDGQTSSDDAERSKPHPDIFEAALAKVPGARPEDALVIGDTPYDAIAARRGGMRPIGVLCGGFSEEQLREAGCVAIFPDVAGILQRYDEIPWSASNN
ncbi:MAG TPA: HAD family hydrolase [Bryobacteraceae bacterium]|nr:HAD family hydrolase [Bryobacteraceae bacterium]